MLHQCDFNGRKDVLHFKLLQAAINEKDKNITEYSSENSSEKLNDHSVHTLVEDETKNKYDQIYNSDMVHFKNKQYPSKQNDDFYEAPQMKKQKKPEFSSTALEMPSKMNKKPSSKFKPVSNYSKHAMDLSRYERKHKNLREQKRKIKKRDRE